MQNLNSILTTITCLILCIVVCDGQDGWAQDGWAQDGWAQEVELEGTRPAHFRVIWTENPSQQATISWSTAKPADKFFIRYRAKTSSEKPATLAAKDGKYIGGKDELYYYLSLIHI